MRKVILLALIVLSTCLAQTVQAQSSNPDDTCHPCILGKTLIKQGKDQIKKGQRLVKQNCKHYKYETAQQTRERRSLWDWLFGRKHKKGKKGPSKPSIPGISKVPEPNQTITDGDTVTRWITVTVPIDSNESSDSGAITEKHLIKTWPGGSDSVYVLEGTTYLTQIRKNYDSTTGQTSSSSITREFDEISQTWERIDRNVETTGATSTITGTDTDTARKSRIETKVDTCDATTIHRFIIGWPSATGKKDGSFTNYSRMNYEDLPETATITNKVIAAMFATSKDVSKIRFIYHIEEGKATCEILTWGCVSELDFYKTIALHSNLEGFWDLGMDDEIPTKKK